MTSAFPLLTYLTLSLATFSGACSVVRVSLPWNGDATAFARELQPMGMAAEIARELGVEVHTGGGGGSSGGSEANWDFRIGFDGDEADRAEFMRALEMRIDEALTDQGIEVSGRGGWSGLPGFRRSYHTSRQRGFLSVYSAVRSDGSVFICGEGEEFPK